MPALCAPSFSASLILRPRSLSDRTFRNTLGCGPCRFGPSKSSSWMISVGMALLLEQRECGKYSTRRRSNGEERRGGSGGRPWGSKAEARSGGGGGRSGGANRRCPGEVRTRKRGAAEAAEGQATLFRCFRRSAIPHSNTRHPACRLRARSELICLQLALPPALDWPEVRLRPL